MAARGGEEPQHGTLNPKAQFQKEITLEQVLKSAMWRIRSSSTTAAPSPMAAPRVVLASEEVARKARRPDLGAGLARGDRRMFDAATSATSRA